MNKGNSSGDSIPNFFKVYVPGGVIGDDLALPMFFTRFFVRSFPENVTVKSIYGKRWRMGLRKSSGDNEKFVLVNGWKRIVRDEDLTGGEFLIFDFDGSDLFTFCIYDRSMNKRLGSSAQTDENINVESESESDGDEEKTSDDNDDIQDEVDGDKDKANDDDYVATDNEEDDDDYTVDDDDADYADDDAEDDDDDDDDADDDDQDGNDGEERTRKLNKEKMKKKTVDKTPKRKQKGASRIGNEDRDYLDDRMNPFFTVNLLKRNHSVRVPAKIIKDYDLKFDKSIYLVDPLVKRFPKMKRKVDIEKNRSVFIRGFGSISRRNMVKSSDKMICELRTKKNGLVCEIKVHIVRA